LHQLLKHIIIELQVHDAEFLNHLAPENTLVLHGSKALNHRNLFELFLSKEKVWYHLDPVEAASPNLGRFCVICILVLPGNFSYRL
jgi:hypothetical protein